MWHKEVIHWGAPLLLQFQFPGCISTSENNCHITSPGSMLPWPEGQKGKFFYFLRCEYIDEQMLEQFRWWKTGRSHEHLWPGEPAELKKHSCCFSTDSLWRRSRLQTMKSIQQQIEVRNASAEWEWRTCLLVLLRAPSTGVLVLQLGGLIITETLFFGLMERWQLGPPTQILFLENPPPVLK